MIYFIAAMCAFFTILVIWKPNFMWSILGAVSYMFLWWYVQTYPPFTLGDFGNVAFISICIGGAAFVLLYTINDTRKKKAIADKEAGNGNHREGVDESSDDYYERLKRVTKK